MKFGAAVAALMAAATPVLAESTVLKNVTVIDGTGAAEYSLLDKINKEKAIIDTAAVMYPQLQDVDFRRQVLSLEVPVYLMQGAHELSARSGPTREWFDALNAPSKQWITFENSGHIPQFEEFPRFRDELQQIVQAQH
jgi:pimeloyl-ACP methyl ester carboxylesterase